MDKVVISATIGCDLDDEARLYEILDAGARMIRVPFWKDCEDQITKNLMRVRKYDQTIPFLIDTKSEKIRFGEFFSNPLPLDPKESYNLVYGKKSKEPNELAVDNPEFQSLCDIGDQIVCGDGEAVLEVVSKENNFIIVRPVSRANLPSRKGFAISGKSIISKDMKNIDYEINYALRNQVDWIAISFTESAQDIEYVRKKVREANKQRPYIMGKIENMAGIKKLEEIVQASDGIMVARGDLPSHTDYGMMALYQKRIIGLCKKYSKFGMVSTGSMMSAISRPRPYPAEISDITNSVLDGADSIQLCEETVYDSSDRVNVVKMTKHIIDTTLNYINSLK